MLNDPWTGSIPDEVSTEFLDGIEDPLVRQEILDLHAKLRLTISDNQRREEQIFQQHGYRRGHQADLNVRFNLLVEMFIGATSPERLGFELKWQEALKQGIEEGLAQAVDQAKEIKRQRLLHGVPMTLERLEKMKGKPDADSAPGD